MTDRPPDIHHSFKRGCGVLACVLYCQKRLVSVSIRNCITLPVAMILSVNQERKLSSCLRFPPPSQLSRLLLLSLLLEHVPLTRTTDTCYYESGARAASYIVPCPSTASPTSCCQLGDICLSDNACLSTGFNITYLYGCTDPTYQDATCPYKCNLSDACTHEHSSQRDFTLTLKQLTHGHHWSIVGALRGSGPA